MRHEVLVLLRVLMRGKLIFTEGFLDLLIDYQSSDPRNGSPRSTSFLDTILVCLDTSIASAVSRRLFWQALDDQPRTRACGIYCHQHYQATSLHFSLDTTSNVNRPVDEPLQMNLCM